MTVEALLRAADRVMRWFPDATITTNQVGNLAILNGGQYVGWIDLRDGTVNWIDTTNPSTRSEDT